VLREVKFLLVDDRSRNGAEYTAAGAINLDDVSALHQARGSCGHPSVVEVHMRSGDVHRIEGRVAELLAEAGRG
jgi:hypothetical protein